MFKLFIISDQHFYHTKIIEYESRPFANVHEMNNFIINENNKIVSNNDIVLNLGDFSFGGKKLVKEIFDQLNGIQYLILGNHDRGRSLTWWKNVGFIETFKGPINLGNYILSHEPLNPSEIEISRKVNIHGHIHSNVHYTKFLDSTDCKDYYFNFCVETLNYKPFEIKDLILKKQILNFLDIGELND